MPDLHTCLGQTKVLSAKRTPIDGTTTKSVVEELDLVVFTFGFARVDESGTVVITGAKNRLIISRLVRLVRIIRFVIDM